MNIDINTLFTKYVPLFLGIAVVILVATFLGEVIGPIIVVVGIIAVVYFVYRFISGQ